MAVIYERLEANAFSVNIRDALIVYGTNIGIDRKMAMPFICRFFYAAIYYALLHSIYAFTVKTDVQDKSNP